MNKERRIVKIRTLKGRIITLTVSGENNTHIMGRDKYDDPVVVPLEDIDEMMPVGDHRE